MWLIVGAVAVIIALTSFVTNDFAARRGDSDRQSLAVALSQLRASNVRALAAEAKARINAEKGAEAERQVAIYEMASRRAVASSSKAWAKFDSLVANSVCDSGCIGVARSGHLSDSIALVASQSALAAEKVAAARYKLGLEDAVGALHALRASAASVETVGRPMTKRKSRLSRLLPTLGVSATAGLDLSGKPNVVTGISLGYSL